jgi:hypothetical protein
VVLHHFVIQPISLGCVSQARLGTLMGSNRVPAWVWALLIVGHATALAWALYSGGWNFTDSGRYLQAAENLRAFGELYARPWTTVPRGQDVQEFTIRSLGYPLAVYALGSERTLPVLLLLVQNLLSLLNLGLVLRWWNSLMQPSRVDWLWASVAIFSFPAQFIYASVVMSEMVMQTLALLIVVAGLLFIRTLKCRFAFGAAVAVTLGLLVKPVFYPLAGGLALLGTILAWRSRRLALFAIGLVPLVSVLFYMGWNYQRTGYFHYSSIAEINLLHYNAAGVVRQAQGAAAEEQWVSGVLAEANAQPSFAGQQHLIRARATTVLLAHPVLYARQHAQGMAAFFLDPGRFDVAQFFRLKQIGVSGLLTSVRDGSLLQAFAKLPLGLMAFLAIILSANVVRAVLALRGFLLLGSGGPLVRIGRWLAAGLLLYVALLTGPLGAARFLVPVWPLLLALALVGQQGQKGKNALRANDKPLPMGESQR